MNYSNATGGEPEIDIDFSILRHKIDSSRVKITLELQYGLCDSAPVIAKITSESRLKLDGTLSSEELLRLELFTCLPLAIDKTRIFLENLPFKNFESRISIPIIDIAELVNQKEKQIKNRDSLCHVTTVP